MKIKIKFVLLLILCFTALSAEEFSLSIRYLGIKIVNVKMEDQDSVLTISANSTTLASIAAKMNNIYQIEYENNYLPKNYRKLIKQRNYIEDRITEYRRERSIANRISKLDNNLNCSYPIHKETRDFFSSLFYLRNNLNRHEGIIWLDANKLLWKAKYEIIGKEEINTKIGKLESYKVKLTFDKYSQSEKERSDMLTNNLVDEDDILYFWFSAGERKIPLKAIYSMKPFPVTWKIESYHE